MGGIRDNQGPDRPQRVQLLGAARARADGAWHAFLDDRRYHLLAFLAVQGGWVDRERLAALFWPEHDDAAGRRNLRKLIFRVRALPWLTGLEVEDTRLRWRVEGDVAPFVETCDARDWRAAVARYDGPLLGGLRATANPAFREWLERERQALAARWRQALFGAAEARCLAGEAREACALLERLLEHDELDEAALRAYMRAAGDAGERGRALQAYRAFAQRLERELGLEPDAETEALRRAAEAGEVAPPAAVGSVPGPLAESAPRTALPPADTSFVGRTSELAAIERMLRRGEGRLVTLVGAGGSGKTRLGLEALRRLGSDYSGGVAFVPLAALHDADAVPLAVAEALGLPLEGGGSPLQQLTRRLGDARTLLLLDNAEQLAEGSALFGALLRACPQLRLIVTSRERLRLHGEQLLPVDGLDGPAADAEPEAVLECDAVRLFAERVARVRPDLDLGVSDAPALRTICRLVDGSPLALELAATWTRLLSCDAIATEIAAGLDFLRDDARDGDPRHRNLRAVFEPSWRALDESQRAALRALSVFPGAFPNDAARRVADAPLPLLAELVDRSLLRVDASGRYDLHPLIRHYLREKLAAEPGEERAALERHVAWTLAWLDELEAAEPPDGIHRPLGRAFEDLRLAWTTAIDRAAFPAVRRLAGALGLALARYARYREGRELFADGRRRLETAGPDAHAALATALTHLADFHYRLAEFPAVLEACDRALELLTDEDDGGARIRPHTFLGAAAMELGDFGTARRHVEAALALVRERRPQGLADALGNLAVIEDVAGDHAAAEAHYLQALAAARAQGREASRASILNGYGRFLLNAGQVDRAEALLEEGLSLAREHDLPDQTAPLVSHLARARWQQGDLERAERYAERARTLAREEGWQLIWIEASTTLGMVARDRDDPAAAEHHLLAALRRGWASRQRRMVLAALLELALLRLRQERPAVAAAYLARVAHDPAAEYVDRRRAETLLRDLPAEHVPPDPEAAAPLEAIVEALALPAPLSGAPPARS